MSFQGQEFTKLFHLSFCVISLSCLCLPHVQIFQIFMQELSTLVTSTECLLWGEHAVVTGCKLAICNEQWNQLTNHNLTVSSAIFQFHHWGLLLNQNQFTPKTIGHRFGWRLPLWSLSSEPVDTAPSVWGMSKATTPGQVWHVFMVQLMLRLEINMIQVIEFTLETLEL